MFIYSSTCGNMYDVSSIFCMIKTPHLKNNPKGLSIHQHPPPPYTSLNRSYGEVLQFFLSLFFVYLQQIHELFSLMNVVQAQLDTRIARFEPIVNELNKIIIKISNDILTDQVFNNSDKKYDIIIVNDIIIIIVSFS